MPYLTEQGDSLSLGNQIAKGSFAGLYEIVGDKERLAKIYHKPPLERMARKLAAMIPSALPEVLKYAAWPVSTLRPAADQAVRGILMRRIAAGRPLNDLAGPAHRRIHFPAANWRFLVRAAQSCVLAVDALHRAGI